MLARDGRCQACDTWGRVDDMSLCEDCATRLERDLIRQRAWDYFAAAFGLPPEAQEELRSQVIAEFGEKLELIAPEEEPRQRHPKRRRKRKSV